MKDKLIEWNNKNDKMFNFHEIEISNESNTEDLSEKNYVNYCFKKYLKDFFGKNIPDDKEEEVLNDFEDFIDYSRKANEIKFKYTGISDVENNIEENEYEYQNTNKTILIYNDNTKMSIVDNDINKYALQLLDNNIYGYKKYI